MTCHMVLFFPPSKVYRYCILSSVITRDRNHVYDAEMQNLNHQAVKKLELPRRSRFYQSAMDMDHLDKGRSYRDLPEGKVLFLCTFDPFGLGYVKYSFQNRCEENKALCLRDGTEKIFYNCVSSAEEMPEHLKELYDYIRTGRAESALTRKIEEAVGRARRNEEWRTEYMKELLHDDDVRQEGLSEGLGKGRIEGKRIAAINLKAMNMPTEQIAQAIEEKVEVVEQWLAE